MKKGQTIKKPFSLYTYYLLAILGTLVIPAIIVSFFEVFAEGLNKYITIALFPTIFIGILLVGYFKWQRYRRLTGEKTSEYGLLSTPPGLIARSVDEQSSQKKDSQVPLHRREIPSYVVLIAISLTLLLIRIIFEIFFEK